MRLIGVALLLVGLMAVVVGSFSGCGTLFSWNGRHPVKAVPLAEGPSSNVFVPEPGRRYTLSVQVVFDREGLPTHDGVTVVDAKMPLVIRVKDAAGTSLAEATGWLNPNEPPNVLFGQTAKPSTRMPDLYVERLVGPFIAASEAPLSVNVDLGTDRVGTAAVVERRLVIHDDRLPPQIKNAFIAAAAGGAAFFTGIVLLVIGWLKRRRRTPKRGGVPAPDVV